LARIIYVEDDDLMGSIVKDILTAAGHLIGVVSHGTLGFETIAFKKPEMIIVDMSLPGMSGIEVIQRLRRLPATYLTPILMLTANKDPNMRDEAMGAGANDFMTKPFSAEELTARVEQVWLNNPFGRRSD
jgi:two-component system response regulator MtrA